MSANQPSVLFSISSKTSLTFFRVCLCVMP